MLRGGGLRDVVVCDDLFDVGQLLVKVFAAFLLFPVAWELLRGKTETNSDQAILYFAIESFSRHFYPKQPTVDFKYIDIK